MVLILVSGDSRSSACGPSSPAIQFPELSHNHRSTTAFFPHGTKESFVELEELEKQFTHWSHT
jgi:hypothetical protein